VIFVLCDAPSDPPTILRVGVRTPVPVLEVQRTARPAGTNRPCCTQLLQSQDVRIA
jgi:hypothetical protein